MNITGDVHSSMADLFRTIKSSRASKRRSRSGRIPKARTATRPSTDSCTEAKTGERDTECKRLSSRRLRRYRTCVMLKSNEVVVCVE